MEPTERDGILPVRRGRHVRERLPETPETHVVRLITQAVATDQAAQVSLVSGDATAHEDSVLSVDVDDVDPAYALAQATGLLPDYDKCQAYIADVHSAFRSGS